MPRIWQSPNYSLINLSLILIQLKSLLSTLKSFEFLFVESKLTRNIAIHFNKNKSKAKFYFLSKKY